MYRLASLIVAGAAILAGFAAYAEPPANPGDDPPVLLKKKGAPEIDDPAPPAEKDKDKDPDKKPADAAKPGADKGEPDKPQIDADEVLSRVAKNMRSLEEKLTAVGAPVETRLYPNISHVMIMLAISRPFRARAPVLDDVHSLA